MSTTAGPEHFTCHLPAMRVQFGSGCLNALPTELDALAAKRVLVLCTPDQTRLADRAGALLAERQVGTFSGAVMHVPHAVAQAGLDAARTAGAELCVAIGGGSTIGLAKAIALMGGPPFLAIPTTYAGSEMTPVWGLTEVGVKRTGRDPRVLPAAVIYDPELTLSLPPGLSAVSGLNAIAHAVEALYAPDSNPIVSLMAEEGIRLLSVSLPSILGEPANAAARAGALQGAWLCGTCLGTTTMGLHHKLCHALGGGFDLPHAETHAVVLPYAAAFNAAAAPDAMSCVARGLGADDAPEGLWRLGRMLKVPASLAALGLTETDLDHAALLATANAYANPRPVTVEGIRALLLAALKGEPPPFGTLRSAAA